MEQNERERERERANAHTFNLIAINYGKKIKKSKQAQKVK